MELGNRKWGNGEDQRYVSLVSQFCYSLPDVHRCIYMKNVYLKKLFTFNGLGNFKGIII